MKGSADNLFLLFLGKTVEINSIAGDTNGQIRIFLRIFICFHQFLFIQYIYIDMMSVLRKITR